MLLSLRLPSFHSPVFDGVGKEHQHKDLYESLSQEYQHFAVPMNSMSIGDMKKITYPVTTRAVAPA